MSKDLFGVVIILILLNVASAGNYDGYKCYAIFPAGEEESHALSAWVNVNGVDLITKKDAFVLIVAPDIQQKFEDFLNLLDCKWMIISDDVEKDLSDIQAKYPKKQKNIKKGNYSFDDYHRHQVMNDYLDRLGKKYSKYVTVKNEGLSYENRTIKSIRITDGKGSQDKLTIFIDCGLHAREWMAPTFCMYLIYQLTEKRLTNIEMLGRVEWFIIPLANPDGYEYSHTDKLLWRKTRRPDDLDPTCKGVDANRNFPYEWSADETSSDPCSDVFGGRMPFSEPETRLLGKLIMIEATEKPGKVAYLSFHSFGYWLTYPWGYSNTAPLPSSLLQLKRVSNKIVNAVLKYSGNTYKSGSTARLLYPAPGGSDDFAMGSAGIELAFTVELPPEHDYGDKFDFDNNDDKGYNISDFPKLVNGFFPPTNKIIPICNETMILVKEFGKFFNANY